MSAQMFSQSLRYSDASYSLAHLSLLLFLFVCPRMDTAMRFVVPSSIISANGDVYLFFIVFFLFVCCCVRTLKNVTLKVSQSLNSRFI